MKRHSRVDHLINDPQVAGARNVILLQVTATPYSLLTRNSRYGGQNLEFGGNIFIGLKRETGARWQSTLTTIILG